MDFKIWCNNEQELNNVLITIQRANIKWCTGKTATEVVPHIPCGLFVEDNEITYTNMSLYFKSCRLKEITVDEYLNTKEKEMFKLEDIKAGMLVTIDEYGNTSNCIVNYNKNDVLGLSDGVNFWHDLSSYDENLERSGLDYKYKIVAVYGRAHNQYINSLSQSTRTLLWERVEPKEMTVAEIEKILGYPVKIVKE